MVNFRMNDVDNQLTGNPQITYFKNVYRRHTYFVKQLIKDDNIFSISQNSEAANFINTYQFEHGSMDLISDIYIENQFKDVSGSNVIIAPNIGNSIIEEIKFGPVGNDSLYKTTGLQMEILAELTNPFSPSIINSNICPPFMESDGLNSSLTVKNGNNYNTTCFAGGVSGSDTGSSISGFNSDIFFTRPDFDFCQTYDKAFPICALNNVKTNMSITYHDRKDYLKGINISGNLLSTIVCEIISLSPEERRRVINREEPYIFFRLSTVYEIPKNMQIIISGITPIRTIYITGPVTSLGSISASLSLSTPTKINSDIILTINNNNGKSFDHSMKTYTRSNIYTYYGNNGFGGRELNDLGEGLATNLGKYDSIGIHTQSLEPGFLPNGHMSSNGQTSLIIKGGQGIREFHEVITSYQISGGQLTLLYGDV